MTLDQLLMLKAVAETGSLKLASERLHKSQPAISQGIRQLESHLNLSLFNRDGYRLVLTEQGQLIFQHVLRLTHEAEDIKQVAKHLARGNEKSITLAFEGSFDLSRILPVLELTQNEYPHTQIILQQENLTGAVEALSLGKADIVISPLDIVQINAMQIEITLMHQGKIIAVAAPCLLARHPQLKFSQELINEYQIIIKDTGTGSAGREFGVQEGQRRWYVNDYSTKKMLILRGMGWGKLPDHLMTDAINQGALSKITLLNKPNEIDFNYYVIKAKASVFGPVAKTLWKNLCLHAIRQS